MANWIKAIFSKSSSEQLTSGVLDSSMKGVQRKKEGDSLIEAGESDAAERCYREALRLDPGLELAYRDLCLLLCQQGRWKEARQIIAAGVERFPCSAEFLFFLGNIDYSTGQWEEAAASFEAAIALEPDFAPAYVNLSTVLERQGKRERAIIAIDGALRLDGGAADSHVRRGHLLQMEGELEEAMRSYQRAITLQPDLVQAHANLGSLYEQMLRPETALAAYLKALALRPEDAELLFNAGSALQSQWKFAEAISYYRRALSIDPNHVKSWVNMSRALELLEKYDESLACYDEIEARYPEMTMLRVNKAHLLLRLGRYSEGWREYEYREKNCFAPVPLDLGPPPWLGKENLSGKSILLYFEQGYGDALHFMRYTEPVAAQGAKIYLFVPPALKSLAFSCPGVQTVLTHGDNLPPVDYMCSLMSLPFALNTQLDTIPGRQPYLRAEAARIDHWKEKVGTKTAALRVGLTWAGDPRKHQPMNAAMDRVRSMRFEQLAPLLDVPDVEFFSLQLGEGTNWQPENYPQVVNLVGEIRDFHATAALLSQIDLVISVDTSMVHLAGALGKPSCMLDRFDHCYRWLLKREDSPWYPNLRIFRQPQMGDWNSVVQRVRLDLRALVESVGDVPLGKEGAHERPLSGGQDDG